MTQPPQQNRSSSKTFCELCDVKVTPRPSMMAALIGNKKPDCNEYAFGYLCFDCETKHKRDPLLIKRKKEAEMPSFIVETDKIKG